MKPTITNRTAHYPDGHPVSNHGVRIETLALVVQALHIFQSPREQSRGAD